MSNDRIAAKVRKLLAIAGDEGASDAEIQNAMNHAHRIMDKHHLTEDDLGHEPDDDYAKVDKAEFGTFRAYVGKKAFTWECRLASFVSEFAGVPVYIDPEIRIVRAASGFAVFDENDDPKYGKSFVYFGVAEDCRIAVELYNELRSLIATMAVGRWGTVYRGDGAAYSEGFVAGLYSQLKRARIEERNESSSTALVLSARRDELVKYKKSKATAWLKRAKGINLSRSQRRSGSNGSWRARSEGVQDGANTDVTATRRRKIGN